MKSAFFIVFTFLVIIHQQGIAQDERNIVVTSSWTAAYAKMAGIEDFNILAPADMQHPSEYELQIDDILKLKNADLIICGGYEIMMDKVRTGLKIDQEKILQIKTDYNLSHINESVIRIAKISGTKQIAEENLERLTATLKHSKEKIKKAGISQIPVLVQFFIRPISEELGLNISGVYGPRQLEAFDIQEMMKLDFNLILDNAHNPSAKPLVESKESVRIAYLLNFPGTGNTETIEDVINYNVDRIIRAYNKNP
jgi:zinc transport system substrate-binding protein